MKFPSHIILDASKSFLGTSSQYWVLKHLSAFKNINNSCGNDNTSLSPTSHQKYYFKKELNFLNELIKNQKKFTVRYSLINPLYFLSETVLNFYASFFKVKYKVKNRDDYSKHVSKDIYNFRIKTDQFFDEKYLKKLLVSFKIFNRSVDFKTDKLSNLFDINFIRKEKIYTKLKYSRVPQYDIVSGGAAAIFGGFLGFLICEKFGFELLDSGDFYFLFMYLVFLFFFLRLFLKIMDNGQTSWNVLSLKWLLYFYQTLAIISFKNLYKLYKFFSFK